VNAGCVRRTLNNSSSSSSSPAHRFKFKCVTLAHLGIFFSAAQLICVSSTFKTCRSERCGVRSSKIEDGRVVQWDRLRRVIDGMIFLFEEGVSVSVSV